MLFKKRFWQGLSDGTVTLAFRRWRKPTVRAGGSLISPGGRLAIDAVDPVDPAAITLEEANRAGYGSVAELLKELNRGEGAFYRIAFRREGEDPRLALRQDLDFDPVALGRRLDRMDGDAPWTRQALRLIAANQGRRAGDLAPLLGMELRDFKTRIRRLKALGLTISLGVGYRLSPRGQALLGG